MRTIGRFKKPSLRFRRFNNNMRSSKKKKGMGKASPLPGLFQKKNSRGTQRLSPPLTGAN
jgi:hypothetical protein